MHINKSAQLETGDLWEQMLSRENLSKALKRVETNRGAPGVDGMKTSELRSWLHDRWPAVRQRLEDGTYKPQAVLRVMIPKPDGGKRQLGVPTVLDRLVQQAIAQVLVPIFDPGFSEQSFGFRPRRSAHQAVQTAKQYLQQGYDWVVDVDIERFFDRVSHDVVMGRLRRKVQDRRVLQLVRKFMSAGIMADGIKQPVAEGTPQGSPLSPLLANVLLDDLDKELERRGHCFVRYADDIRIFVRSERAAERVLNGVSNFVEQRLKLKVNSDKSKVRPAGHATLLGFGFCRVGGEWKIRVADAAIKRLRLRVRKITRRMWRISMQDRIDALNKFIAGWMAYFHIAEVMITFRDVDRWLRRRLRQVRWKEWKVPAARRRNLIALGVPRYKAFEWAQSDRGAWCVAGTPILQTTLTNAYWSNLGLHGFHERWTRLKAR